MSFDPYPLGCPLGVRVTPEQMPEVALALRVELSDLLRVCVHEIQSTAGSYPIVSLFADELERVPRLVWFPAWGTNVRSEGSLLRFEHQCALLEEIAFGTPGADPPCCRGADPLDRSDPLLIPLAVGAQQMDAVVGDLLRRLADVLRITVCRVPWADGQLWMIRLFSLVEDRPRIVLFPGWIPSEQGALELSRADMLAVLRKGLLLRLPEIPIEAFGVEGLTVPLEGWRAR